MFIAFLAGVFPVIVVLIASTRFPANNMWFRLICISAAFISMIVFASACASAPTETDRTLMFMVYVTINVVALIVDIFWDEIKKIISPNVSEEDVKTYDGGHR